MSFQQGFLPRFFQGFFWDSLRYSGCDFSRGFKQNSSIDPFRNFFKDFLRGSYRDCWMDSFKDSLSFLAGSPLGIPPRISSKFVLEFQMGIPQDFFIYSFIDASSSLAFSSEFPSGLSHIVYSQDSFGNFSWKMFKDFSQNFSIRQEGWLSQTSDQERISSTFSTF